MTPEKVYNSEIPIRIKVYEDDGCFVTRIEDENFSELSGCIAQGETEDEAKRELAVSIKCMLDFLKSESVKYSQRAIFRGNWSKHQMWFTIIGVGIVFYWQSRSFKNRFPKSKPTYKFHVGRLWWSFKNNWRNNK